MYKIYMFSLILIIAVLIIACDSTLSGDNNANVVEREGKVFIEDQTGKMWDITHAVDKYGFSAGNFQFGLGPFAITPINDPEMLSPGNAGYPDANDERLVIGTTINNDTRAYSLNVLSRHEIANERFGDAFVSVAY
jgi:hypothetical protein